MSWEYSDNEYLKLFRKLVRWEWYTDVNTKTLFIHCLIRANWKDGSWRGIDYKRGQFITSLSSLSKETGLSVQNVRTALAHLELTGELTSQITNQYRLISVVNYDEYQSNQQGNQQAINKEPTSKLTNDQQATNNRYKNNKNNKEVEENNMASPEDEIDDGIPWWEKEDIDSEDED